MKVPVVDDVLSSLEQRDRNVYVDLPQTHLALKIKQLKDVIWYLKNNRREKGAQGRHCF